MDRLQVVTTLKALATGVDPATNTAADHVFSEPDVIRALFLAAEMLSERTDREKGVRKNTRPPASAGSPWSDGEDAQLAREFDSKMDIPDIARHHSRTRGAIMSRLVKLGKVDASSVRRRER